jgi:hypothetical protein
MKYSKVILAFFILFGLNTSAQEIYTIEFSKDKWDYKPSLYYISDVIDERSDTTMNGQVLSGNKFIKANFKNSLSQDLKKLIVDNTKQDTTLVPLVLAFDKLILSETGNTASHKATVDFSLKIYRIISGKKYKAFETNGKPELDMRGPFQNPHEKIIREILKSTLKSFDMWINEHPDQPPLAKSVKVFFDKKENFNSGDTIFWNKEYRLKWSDFRGKPDATPFMAQSNCAFTFKPQQSVKDGIMELHVFLNANFDKNSSWVKPGQQKDSLLAHEQLHFDICEVYIRKLKKTMLDFTFNPMEMNEQIRIMFESAWKDYQDAQQKYDDETMHGLISDKQLVWRMDISEQLKATESLSEN